MRLAFAPLALVLVSACKREPVHKDLATLPHVERTRGSKETVTPELSSEVVREPKAPGDFAFHKVIRKMVEPAGVRVVSMDVRREHDQLGQNDDRHVKAQCSVRVEFVEDGEDDWCGALRPVGGQRCRGKWEAGGPCDREKVRRNKGEPVELRGELWAMLDGKNGWAVTMGEYDDGRRFFGDETREVE